MFITAIAFGVMLQTVAATDQETPAHAAAVANKARAKTAPSFIKEPDYVRPASSVAAGEFGEVVISGIVGVDGKLSEAKIASSSKSAAIDALALASVPMMLFEPARDANGTALSIPATLPLEYAQTDFHGPHGLAHYQCAQFVKDYDWWTKTWPTEKHDRVFDTLRGYSAVWDMNLGKSSGDFGVEWAKAIEACRKSPDKLMLDMLKPHGRILRTMIRD